MLRPVGPDHYKLIRLDFGFVQISIIIIFFVAILSLRHYPLIVKNNTEYRP